MRRDRWLVVAFCLGPFAALSDLVVAYALVPQSCENGSKTILHVVTAAFVLVALCGAAIAESIRRTGFSPSPLSPPSPGRAEARPTWSALVAMVLCLYSAVVILALEIPNIILRSCD